ncbi:MAG: hypothetical protein MJ162_06405 [Treponema sp.]|nr:hypothetical protein [Treponema sp.]
MKRLILSLLLIFSICCSGFAKELEGKDLEAVYKVLNMKLPAGNFKEPAERLAFITEFEKQIIPLYDDISEEAKIICKNIIALDKENCLDKKQKSEDRVKACVAEYKNFAEKNKNLSSYFYFHQKEAEMNAAFYLSLAKQLEMMKNVITDYKALEVINPENSECKFFLGAILYFAPKIGGGNKPEGMEKIKSAIEKAGCDYEYATAVITYSQFLYEEKNYDESKLYLNKALEKYPDNNTIKELKEMNDAGYSMFQIEKYKKAKKKK